MREARPEARADLRRPPQYGEGVTGAETGYTEWKKGASRASGAELSGKKIKVLTQNQLKRAGVGDVRRLLKLPVEDTLKKDTKRVFPPHSLHASSCLDTHRKGDDRGIRRCLGRGRRSPDVVAIFLCCPSGPLEVSKYPGSH